MESGRCLEIRAIPGAASVKGGVDEGIGRDVDQDGEGDATGGLDRFQRGEGVRFRRGPSGVGVKVEGGWGWDTGVGGDVEEDAIGFAGDDGEVGGKPGGDRGEVVGLGPGEEVLDGGTRAEG